MCTSNITCRGARDKWTRLRCCPGSTCISLAAACDNTHTHRQWGASGPGRCFTADAAPGSSLSRRPSTSSRRAGATISSPVWSPPGTWIVPEASPAPSSSRLSSIAGCWTSRACRPARNSMTPLILTPWCLFCLSRCITWLAIVIRSARLKNVCRKGRKHWKLQKP